MALMTLRSVSLKSAGVTEKMVQEQVESTGMRTVAYDSQFRYFRVSIDRLDLAKQRDVPRDLIQQAWKLYGRP